MGNLSTDPYKGVRDFYPEDQAVQNYIFSVWRKVVESYGYEEYNTSILEPAELYRSKTSEEIVNEQTYTFTDRGDREVTLRPEMTPSVARLVAAKRRELAYPVRWYSIQNFFRYERPQRGRVREFWQLNADSFGIDQIAGDTEAILLAHDVMKAFGASESDYQIRINDRALLQKNLEALLRDPSQVPEAMRLIDRKEKMSLEEFEMEWEKLSDKAFVMDPGPEIGALIDRLEQAGVGNAVFYPTLVRGFDYYTGIVFEIFDTNPENSRSIFGGGRYDQLLELFETDTISTIGFAIGDVTMRDFLETHGLLPAYTSTTDVMVCVVKESATETAWQFGAQLRAMDVKVAIYSGNKKVGDQIQIADKKKIPFVVCVGDEEVASGTYTLKTLATGKELKGTATDIAAAIKSARL